MIDPKTPIWQLTVGDFVSLMQSNEPKVVEIQKDDEEYYTTLEACRYLKISKSTLMRWKESEYLKADKVGGILRFRKSELNKVLNP